MDKEDVMNGSHEPEIEVTEEKILKMKKSIHQTVIENGNSEHEHSVDDNNEESEVINGDTFPAHLNGHDKGGMNAPDTPTKRELRRRGSTSREVTPRPETPSKRSKRIASARRSESVDTDSVKVTEEKDEDSDSVIIVDSDDSKHKDATVIPEDNINVEDDNIINEDSVILVECSMDTKEEEVEEGKPETRGFFSVFRMSPKASPPAEVRATSEASPSSSVICLDNTPSVILERDVNLSNKISGRRAINCFSRFSSGSTTSPNTSKSSMKRKADDCFDDDLPNRYIGECNSGSEKSPGWSFFSRVWSPSPKKAKSSISSSTPFWKNKLEDSMAVNYNEESKMVFEETIPAATDLKESPACPSPAPVAAGGRWCSVM